MSLIFVVQQMSAELAACENGLAFLNKKRSFRGFQHFQEMLVKLAGSRDPLDPSPTFTAGLTCDCRRFLFMGPEEKKASRNFSRDN